MILAITGTDTGVGKTVVTAALAAAHLAAGRTVAVYKPVQTGEPPATSVGTRGGDTGEVERLAGAGVVLAEGARFAEPMAPIAAAAAEGSALPGFEDHVAAIGHLHARTDVVLVEGAGGLLVRLTAAGHTIADVARAAGGRLVVVARAGLGTLNHTELTLEGAAARGVPVAGVVLGAWPAGAGHIEESNADTLRGVCADAGVGWWGALPDGAGAWDAERFGAAAVRWFGCVRDRDAASAEAVVQSNV
ncbi:dethiobiotin synthase [Kocuria polaris]|nr:dethiobiotin synthase [Kocuria polaris]